MNPKKNTQNSLFYGKTFLDAALEIRRLREIKDMLPLVRRHLGVTQKDLELCPLRLNNDVITDIVKRIPNVTDELYGMVPDSISNAMHTELLRTVMALLFPRPDTRTVTALDELSPKDINVLFAAFTMHVGALVREMAFLWYEFHEHKPNITFVTDDAFELVNNTKLDESITKEMADRAFPEGEDLFISMNKSIHGYCEFAVLNREGRLTIVFGPKMKHPTYYDKSGAADYVFSPEGTIDLVKQYGGMNADNIATSIFENQERHHLEKERRLSALARESGFEHNPDGSFKDFEGDLLKVDSLIEEKSDETDRRHDGFRRSVYPALIGFAMKLRLMMTAEKTPVEEVHAVKGSCVRRNGIELPPQKDGGATYSVVSLTKEFYEARERYRKSAGTLDKEGKSLVEKQVSGFLRRQHYGPKNGLEKYIYIAPFTNRFWVNDAVHVTKVVK